MVDRVLPLVGDPWPYRKKSLLGLLILLVAYATLVQVLRLRSLI